MIQRAPDAMIYLQNGSDEQKELLKEMGGDGKLLSILAKIDEPLTLNALKKKLSLQDFSAKKYLHILLEKNLVRIVRNCPKIGHVPEKELPMLVIKGLSEDDVALVEELEQVTGTKKNISEISLELEEKPERIERVLRVLGDYVTWETPEIRA